MRDSNKLYVGQTGSIVTFKTYVDKNPHLRPHGFVWNADSVIYCELCKTVIGNTGKMKTHAESCNRHIQLF